MGGQRLARGVRVIPLVKGCVVLCELSYVSLGRVGRSGGHVLVPVFE